MRQQFLISATLLLFLCSGVPGQRPDDNRGLFRIRTITAGVNLQRVDDLETIDAAIAFLERTRRLFESAGYVVQTVHIATQPLPEYLAGMALMATMPALKQLDARLTGHRVVLAPGPVLTANVYDPAFADWAVQVIRETKNISFSVTVASPAHGIHTKTARTAAETMTAIAPPSRMC